MWQRILRILTATGYAYNSPLRFLATVVGLILIPYAAYIFWGSLALLILAAAGIYFLFRLLGNSIDAKNA